MYRVINKGSAVVFEGQGLTLEGSGVETALPLAGRSIAFLECEGLRVETDLILTNNLLKTLRGGPYKVGNRYEAADCQLEALDIRECEVGSLKVAKNPRLKSLAGLPAQVTKMVDANECGLESLDCEYAEVGGGFYVSDNPLTSLRGGPRSIGWDYLATNCPLTEIGLRDLTLTGTFTIQTWTPKVEQKLRHVLDVPRCELLEIDEDIPVLGACGRCERIDFGNKQVTPRTVFRTKLEILTKVSRLSAKIGDL